MTNKINGRDFSAPRAPFAAPSDLRPKVLDTSRVRFCVSKKLKPNNKATRTDIADASQVRQKPGLLLSRLPLALAAVPNHSTMCRVIVVKPYAKIALYRNDTLIPLMPFVPQHLKKIQGQTGFVPSCIPSRAFVISKVSLSRSATSTSYLSARSSLSPAGVASQQSTIGSPAKLSHCTTSLLQGVRQLDSTASLVFSLLGRSNRQGIVMIRRISDDAR